MGKDMIALKAKKSKFLYYMKIRKDKFVHVTHFHCQKSGDTTGFGDKSGEKLQIGPLKDFMQAIFPSIGSNL